MKNHLFLLAFVMLLSTSLLAQKASPRLIGKTNFPSYIDEAPGLPATIEEAAKRVYGSNNFLQADPAVLEKIYQPFYDKIDGILNQYKANYGDKITAYNEQEGEEGIRQRMEAEVNKNPIIAQMGGVEKVQNMSEAEAKAAALQAANNYIQNPGFQSAGMTALYQKVVSDPAYAARFEKMSDKEKEVELRKYMAGDQVVAKTPQQMAAEQKAQEAQNQQKNKVQNAMEINQVLLDFQTKIAAVRAAYEQEFAAVTNAPNNHAAIEIEHGKKLKAIPIVELGEYGHDHDPVKAQALQLEMLTKHRTLAVNELKQYQALLSKLRMEYKKIANEYLTAINQNRHKINGNPEDLYNGTQTELAVASFEMELLSLATDVAKHSEQLTKDVAYWEAEYQKAKQAK